MSSNRVTSYARAMLAIAEAEENTEEVADEMFRFARALEGSDELRMTLTDQRIPADRRQQIVEDLLDGRASKTTAGLVSMVVGTGRAGELPNIADELVELSAAGSKRRVARVRSAVPLSDDQQSRLADALTKSTGSPVELKVIVDPNVVGGVVTEIGDTVIDGSLRTRLAQLKEAF